MSEENKNKPLLSVIIPCYKVEKYLDRCMKSVVNQTYGNLEIILVDDGSPDNTGKMCDNWAARDSRIKVVHKKNGGLGFARNSGIEVATGEWIAFVDSDDYILSEMYERLMAVALDTRCDIAYGGHIKQKSDGSEVEVNDFAEELIFVKSQLLELSQGFFRPIPDAPKMLTMSVWHAVYRRSVCTKSFFSEREVGSEDIPFQANAVLAANKVVFIPECLYVYCYNGESLSHTLNVEKFKRYQILGEKLNELYRPFGISHVADYAIFMMGFATIRRIMLSDNTQKQKRKAISTIVNDDIWQEVKISSKWLDFQKSLFLRCLRIKSPILMEVMARAYCFINYTLRNQSND